MLNLPKNIWVMSVVMSLSFASTAMMVLIAGLIGSTIAPDPSMATLPYAVVIIGTACATIPAAMLMQRIGRKMGVLVGLCIALTAAALAIYAVNIEHFWLFVLASFLLGTNAAFAQQGRFIILENAVGLKQQADGLTLALLANLMAAFIGPWMGQYGKILLNSYTWAHADFSGSFILLIALLLFACLSLTQYQELPRSVSLETKTGRSMKEIIRQPHFLVAAGSAAFGFAIMAFVMTATPVSMHKVQGHTLEHTTLVIQTHIVAMFLPSLLTGRLLKLGLNSSLLFSGFTIYLIMCSVAYSGEHVLHYWWALLLLGVGWNLIFMTSTTRLGHTHAPIEKFKAQAGNDFLVFGFQAIAAFSSGLVLYASGWSGVITVAIVMTLCWIFMLTVLLLIKPDKHLQPNTELK